MQFSNIITKLIAEYISNNNNNNNYMKSIEIVFDKFGSICSDSVVEHITELLYNTVECNALKFVSDINNIEYIIIMNSLHEINYREIALFVISNTMKHCD